MRRWAPLLVMVVCLGCAAAPQAAPEGPRTGEGAAASLKLYAQLIRDVHPAPWRFITLAAFDALVEAEAARLAGMDDPGDLEVGAAFQRVAASLRDAHMAIGLRSYQPGVELGPVFLPALIKRVEGAWRVDAATEAALVGSALVSIDGEPLERVIARLEPLIIADGVGAQPRARLLERDFARLYPLVYGLKARYTLGVRDAAGVLFEVVLDGVTRDGAGALRAARRSAPVWGAPARETAQLPFLLNIINGVMWVRMPSFGSADQAGYEARVAALMEGRGEASALVIDLRGNEGGLRTHGIALLNHVLGAPYTQWRAMSARVRSIPRVHSGRVSGAFGVDVRALGELPAPDASGVSRVEGDPLAARMRPVGAAFEGRVVVLADGLTNSAANELIVALKHARADVLLVGEEVGGACGEHVGELPIVWRAPSYGVMALLSLLRLEHVAAEGCQPGRGLLPDVAVVYTAAAFDAGEDPYVDAVAKLLSN